MDGPSAHEDDLLARLYVVVLRRHISAVHRNPHVECACLCFCFAGKHTAPFIGPRGRCVPLVDTDIWIRSNPFVIVEAATNLRAFGVVVAVFMVAPAVVAELLAGFVPGTSALGLLGRGLERGERQVVISRGYSASGSEKAGC